MKKYLILCLTVFALFAADTPPEPNYDIMVPTEDEVVEGSDLIGDNSLEQDKISGTVGYQSNVGETTLRKEISESGKITYYEINEDGEEVEVTDFQKEVSQEYEDTISTLDINNPDSEKLSEAKEKRDEELENQGLNPAKMEKVFLGGVNPDAKGYSTATSNLLNPNVDGYTSDEEEAITKHYADSFTYSQEDTSNQAMINAASKIDEDLNNTGKLIKSFAAVDDIKTWLNSQYNTKNIFCYVSRSLIPKYYCPIVGQTNTEYGGDMSTSNESAKELCNENCNKEIACLNSKILDDTMITFPNVDTMSLYPQWGNIDANGETSAMIFLDGFSQDMSVKKISYTIKITKSEDSELTDEEFEEFLATKKPKFRYTAIKRSDFSNTPPFKIIDSQPVILSSSETKISLNISSVIDGVSFLFYKPYITDNQALASIRDVEDWNQIESIIVDDFHGEYTSDSIYFCPVKQVITDVSECDGGSENVLQVLNNSQVYNICLDSEHKVGQDLTTGGFYGADSCEAICKDEEECQATYRHYSDFSDNAIFNVEVGCVDDPDNTACTKEKCIELFREDSLDEEIRPINEWVVQNNDTKAQTISNRIIQGDTLRPKFDIDKELNITSSYNELFQEEMKDAAFNYMINNTTYDRIEQRIGEVSERKIAYTSELIDGKNRITALLKGQSDHYDDGKNYYLYSIIRVEELFSPVAGVFLTADGYVRANQNDSTDVQFVDRTYIVKNMLGAQEPWSVYKKEYNAQYKVIKDLLYCEDNTYEVRDHNYYANVIIPDGCVVTELITWPETPFLMTTKYQVFNKSTSTFNVYDPNTTTLSHFDRKEFNASSNVISEHIISNFMQLELEETPGLFIKTQESLNNDTSFKRIYEGTFDTYADNYKKRGYLRDYKVYFIYSDKELTVKEAEALMNEDTTLFQKGNPSLYSSSISDDSELKNNIELYLLGRSNNTTIDASIYPFIQEEGQRVFKFLFLHDDSDSDSPFN